MAAHADTSTSTRSIMAINLDINQGVDRDMTLNRQSVSAGVVGIRMSSNSPSSVGHDIAVVHRNAGISLDDLLKNLIVIFDPNTSGSDAANLVQGWLRTNSTWYGGYHANQEGTLDYQTVLRAGHYDVIDLTQLADLASAKAPVTGIDVDGPSS